MTRFRTAASGVFIGLAMAGGACASSSAPTPPARQTGAAANPSVLARASHVADWQLAHMDSFDYVRTFQRQTAGPTDWIQAAFYAGLVAFADATGDPRHAQAVVDHGRAQGWGYGDRPRHADDDAIGQAWLWGGRPGRKARNERNAWRRRGPGSTPCSPRPRTRPCCSATRRASSPARSGGAGATPCSWRRRCGSNCPA